MAWDREARRQRLLKPLVKKCLKGWGRDRILQAARSVFPPQIRESPLNSKRLAKGLSARFSSNTG